MTLKLQNIQIHEISLVKTGANGAQFIAKSADGSDCILATIRKTDAVKKIAVGIVYQPDTPDTDDELATAAEIEKAAWGAIKNQAIVKTDHKDPAAAFLAESYIVKAGDPDKFPEGAWAVVIKVEDDELWKQIEAGEFQAFSMGGKAEKAPLEKGTETPPEDVAKEVSIDSMVYVTGLKDVLEVVNGIAANMGDVAKELNQVVATVKGEQESLTEKSEAIEKTVADVKATIEKIAELATDGRITSPKPGSSDNDPGKY